MVPLALFASLAHPVHTAEWLVMRELFRLSMWLGILPPTGGFWGQIGGLNIPLHSDAFHAIVRFASLAPTFVPLMVVSMLLWYRIRIARRWNAHRWITIRRATLLGLGAALALTLTEDRVEHHVQELAFRGGAGAGCEYVRSRIVFMTPDGPFTGGRWARLFNPLHTHGPWVLAHAGTFALAWIAFALISRDDPRYPRGSCPACGYSLDGLVRCPECGRDAPASGSRRSPNRSTIQSPIILSAPSSKLSLICAYSAIAPVWAFWNRWLRPGSSTTV